MEFSGTLFRGQHGHRDEGLRTQLASLTFSDYEVARTYALHSRQPVICPKIFEARIDIPKLLVNTPDDPFIDYPDLVAALGREAVESFIIDPSLQLYMTNGWERICQETNHRWATIEEVLAHAPTLLEYLPIQLYHLCDLPRVVDLMKQAGYGGALYRGSGCGMDVFEVRVFDTACITDVRVTLL